MDIAAWAAWLDTLLAQGERRAACWGHFSWNGISGQVSWKPCPGSGPSPAMLRLELGEIFPTQRRGTRLGARLDHTQKMVPDLCLLLWWMNLKCSSWKNSWRGIPLALYPTHPRPSPLWASPSSRQNILYGFVFLPELSTTLSFHFHGSPPSVRAQPPPRLQYSTQNIEQVEFCKQKLNIPAWPLFPPEGRFALSPCSSRRPGWATSVGMFSNLITYPCLKLFMVH